MRQISLYFGMATLFIVACSGGGGNNSTPSPPPTPSNTAPTANITAPNGTSADEGQVIILNGSTSSDPEGDTLTFAWSQTGGPTATLSSTTGAQIDITLPETSGDQSLIFQLDVSDGALSDAETVTIDTTDIVEGPIFSLLDQPQIVLTGLESARGLVLTSTMRSGGTYSLIGLEDNGGELDLVYFEKNTDATLDPVDRTPTGEPSNSAVTGRDGYFGFQGSGPAFIFEDAGKIVHFNEQQGSPAWYEVASDDLDAPCSFTSILYGRGMIVGHRGTGLSSILRAPSGTSPNLSLSSEVTTLTNTGTYCFLGKDIASNNLVAAYNSDTDRLEIWQRVFDPMQTPQTQFILAAAHDIDLPAGLEVSGFDSAFLFTPSGEAMFSVLAATNGEHAGEHSAILVYWDAVSGFRTDELSWEKGIPTDVTVGDANLPEVGGGPYSPPIFISMSSSPYIRVYDTDEEFFTLPLAGKYLGAQFIEVGLGSTEIVSEGSSIPSIVVNQPSRGKIVVLQEVY